MTTHSIQLIRNDMNPNVQAFFDEVTHTVTYVVSDPETRACAIIDSVLDFDHNSGRTQTVSADKVVNYIKGHKLETGWILETHTHADHLSAAPYLQALLGGKVAIGENIPDIQRVFGDVFNEAKEFDRDGSQFDHLFEDEEAFGVGSISAKVIFTPGHTPACVCYLIGDAIFVGDTLFMPDYGSARCDFPGGDAGQLYDSVQKIYALPDSTRMFLCHDYKAPGRDDFAWETTIGDQKKSNKHLSEDISREEFIKMRTARDKTLKMPKLILPSIQVNMRAGHLPPAEDDGKHYLKIPINSV